MLGSHVPLRLEHIPAVEPAILQAPDRVVQKRSAEKQNMPALLDERGECFETRRRIAAAIRDHVKEVLFSSQRMAVTDLLDVEHGDGKAGLPQPVGQRVGQWRSAVGAVVAQDGDPASVLLHRRRLGCLRRRALLLACFDIDGADRGQPETAQHHSDDREPSNCDLFHFDLLPCPNGSSSSERQGCFWGLRLLYGSEVLLDGHERFLRQGRGTG